MPAGVDKQPVLSIGDRIAHQVILSHVQPVDGELIRMVAAVPLRIAADGELTCGDFDEIQV